MKKNKIKNIITNIEDFLFELLIWFLIIWLGIIAIAFTYLLPKTGIIIFSFAFIFAIAPKIYKRIKRRD